MATDARGWRRTRAAQPRRRATIQSPAASAMPIASATSGYIATAPRTDEPRSYSRSMSDRFGPDRVDRMTIVTIRQGTTDDPPVMKTAARRTPADRDRAVARLRTMTIGTGIAGVLAVGGFGAIAAASDDGTSGAVTTAALVTTDAATTTSTTSRTTSTTSGTSTSTSTTTTSTTATQATAAPTAATGSAHAATGSS